MPVADDDAIAVAYYARRGGRLADMYTLLHPPYTAWHLSYVVIGAALAPRVDVVRLIGSLLVFLLAVGVAAHALDELRDRPLRTAIPDQALIGVSVVALLASAVVTVAGAFTVGVVLLPAALIGLVLVLGYNLELARGRLHTRWGFAAGWGAYPVPAGCLVQTGGISAPAVAAAAGAFALSAAQRTLSAPARLLRRRASAYAGRLSVASGDIALTRADLLRPLEQALCALSWASCLLATGLILTHWR